MHQFANHSYSRNHIITSPTFGYNRVTTGSPKTHSFWSHPLPWQSALGIFLDGSGFCMGVLNWRSGIHGQHDDNMDVHDIKHKMCSVVNYKYIYIHISYTSLYMCRGFLRVFVISYTGVSKYVQPEKREKTHLPLKTSPRWNQCGKNCDHMLAGGALLFCLHQMALLYI